MTEDTSPENLRKFLESDDPAMRMMGLSMAKGTGSLDKAIIGLHFWDPEEENQKAAGELIKAIGIEKFEEFPGWLEPFDYSKLEKTFGFRLCNHLATSVERIISFADERSTELISECVDYLVKALGIHTRIAQNALTEIGEPAIPNLIKNIRNRKMKISDSCIEILGNIGDSRALNPLLKILELKKESKRRKAFEALENLSKNIEIPLNIKERMAKKIIIWLDEEGWRSIYTYIPFFKEIEMENEDLVVNLLDKSLEDKDMTSGKRKAIISILKKIGGERVVSVLIKNLHKKEAFRDIKYDIRYADYDNAIPKVPTCTDKIFVLVKGGKNSLYGAKYNGKNPKSWMGGDKKYYVSHPVGMAKRDLAFYGYKSVWTKHVMIHVSNSIIKEKDLIFSLSE